MPVHRSHDRPYPTAPRADELPLGTPSSAVVVSRADFDARGKFAEGNSVSRAGGLATAGRTRLSARLGLQGLPEGAEFGPYRRAAASFRKAQCAAIAANVGAGFCGPGPSSMVASAALQLAWSRFLSDRAAATGDPEMALAASRLADASRNNLLSAHELAAKEAKARPAAPVDPLAAWRLPAGEPEPEQETKAREVVALLPEPEPSE